MACEISLTNLICAKLRKKILSSKLVLLNGSTFHQQGCFKVDYFHQPLKIYIIKPKSVQKDSKNLWFANYTNGFTFKQFYDYITDTS